MVPNYCISHKNTQGIAEGSKRCKTTFVKSVFPKKEADDLFTNLLLTTNWVDGPKSKFGKTRKTSSLFLGDNEKVDNAIAMALNIISQENYIINEIYLNYYEDGNSWTPNHTYKNTVQLIISLGDPRTLIVGKKEYVMNNGDVIIFGGLVHGVPKNETKNSRISIVTFMKLKTKKIDPIIEFLTTKKITIALSDKILNKYNIPLNSQYFKHNFGSGKDCNLLLQDKIKIINKIYEYKRDSNTFSECLRMMAIQAAGNTFYFCNEPTIITIDLLTRNKKYKNILSLPTNSTNSLLALYELTCSYQTSFKGLTKEYLVDNVKFSDIHIQKYSQKYPSITIAASFCEFIYEKKILKAIFLDFKLILMQDRSYLSYNDIYALFESFKMYIKLEIIIQNSKLKDYHKIIPFFPKKVLR